MSAIENYPIDFVKRTRDLLTDNFEQIKGKDLEVTFLLNCLLGLIVSVSENKESNSIFNEKINDEFLNILPRKIGFTIKNSNNYDLLSINDINIKIGHKKELTNWFKRDFIAKLRNGIAHQHIEAINEDGKWVGMKLWNINNNKLKDLRLYLQLKN